MTSQEIPIGARVQVTAGIGHVRWVGSNPKFATGRWVGVELEEKKGKNDGSVQGERYFTCPQGYGSFVRPSQVVVLEASPTALRTASRTASPVASRVASTGVTRPAAGASSRNPSPTKAPAPVAGVPSAPTAVLANRPSGDATVPAPIRSTSVLSQHRPDSRPPSVAESSSGAVRRLISPAAGEDDEATEVSLGLQSPADLPEKTATRPRLPSAAAMPPPPVPLKATPNPSSLAGGSGLRRASQDVAVRSAEPDEGAVQASQAVSGTHRREMDELRIKLRIMENRRAEDQEKMKALEAKAEEADTLRAARVKLQAKFQELQSSLVAAHRQARDLNSENAQLQTRATEAFDQLEMAALDREVAEEKAEAAETELAKLNDKVEELEMEVAVLKEENAEYENVPDVGAGDGSAGLPGSKRGNAAYIQLEKHNERLKEALIRLRDMTSDADKEHKAKIAELERDLTSQEDLMSRLEMSEAKVSNSEALVEDLKSQLDDALGAEDMLEQLTERNLYLSERLDELRSTVEDLEALKEVNDELEEGHVETEKQLNLEIDSLSGQLRDERSRSNELDSAVLDLETTIAQFRELVGGLQSEIDGLRTQQVSQELKSSTTTREAQALLDLNMKLQSTASKTRNKTLELDLRKLEAAQVAERLNIVAAYLPDAFHASEESPLSSLLFFRRIAGKVDLLLSTISAAHSLPAALHTASSEALVGICELRGKLRSLGSLNSRFAAILSRSSADEWLSYTRLPQDTAGVEPKLDAWLRAMQEDNFTESDCARDLGRLVAHFENLGETLLVGRGQDAAERQLGLAQAVDLDLDNFAAAVGFARQAVKGVMEEGDIEVDGGDPSFDEAMDQPVQAILDLVRGLKGPASKLIAHVGDLAVGQKALQPQAAAALAALNRNVSNAVDLAVRLAQRVGAHVSAVRSNKETLRLADIDDFLLEVVSRSTASSDVSPWDQIAGFVVKLGEELQTLLTQIRSVTQAGQVISLEAPGPWIARAAAIKEAASFNADTEKKVSRLQEDVKDMLREVKLRDQSLQEAGVKVETLERRLESTRKQAETIIGLENDVAKAKKQEKVYEEAIEQLQAEQDALEAENAKLRKGQGQAQGASPDLNASSALAANLGPTLGSAESSALLEQVENLRSAIRFLRRENALLRSSEMYATLHSLPPLPYRATPELSLPELQPSSPTSRSSSSDEHGPVTPTRAHGNLITRHGLETETKLLLREVAAFQTRPAIVDLTQAATGATGWRSRKKDPEQQLIGWKRKERDLQKRVEKLKERARVLGVVGSGPTRR